MSHFTDSNETGDEAVAAARSWLATRVRPGHPIIDTNEARQAEAWQREIGDLIAPLKDGTVVGVEVKGERRWTGNLFIETWSNRAFGRQRVGWAYTTRADFLVMVYLDVGILAALPTRRLWCWLFEDGNLYKGMPEREKVVGASKRGDQKNQTVGVAISYATVLPAVGGQLYREADSCWWEECTLADAEARLAGLPKV